MSTLGKTPYGFEYDLDIPETYDEAWDKDDAMWKEEDPEGWARSQREITNAKRRKTRAENKAKKLAQESLEKALDI